MTAAKMISTFAVNKKSPADSQPTFAAIVSVCVRIRKVHLTNNA